MSHPALEEHPKYVDRMAVVAEVQSRADLVRDQVLAHQREIDHAAREQEVAIAKAVAEGTPVPPTPPAPASNDALQAALHLVAREQQIALVQTEALVAEIAEEVEDRLRKAVTADMREVADHARAVEEARQRVEDALRAAARVRRAVEAQQSEITRPSRADRTRTFIDTSDLLDLARSGGDVLAPLPVAFREQRILGVVVDERDPTSREVHDAIVATLPQEVRDRLAPQTSGRF